MPTQPNQGNSSSVSYSAANSITSATTQSGQTYTSSTADENALLISTSGNVTLNNPTVTKSGDSDGGDNCNFYGINSAVMAMGGGTVSITGGTVTATAKGANGVFSYGGNGGTNGAAGDGTTVYISGTTINTSGDNGGGIMTTGGGNTVARNLTITTTGNSSAPIRTDRGGGSVTVSGGSYTSSGLGSPAIYSTADITVENATLTSNKSEGVCIEGQNSVALTNCTLNASNTQTNGNAQFLDAVILYQSQSGDAASGTASFTMTNGTINNTSGHVFHVTNTSAVISLTNVTINDSGSGVLLSVCDDGWSGASNIATLNASGQTLDGDILVGDDSTLTLNLTNGSTFTGKVSGSITNNAGTTVSSDVGTVNVSLDATSKWYLEEDTYISTFSGTNANVITSGYTLYVNNIALDGTTETEETDTSTGVSISNTASGTLITGTAYGDSISNSGERVTINALAGNDTIDNYYGDSVSIDAGAGNDSIYNYYGDNVTIDGGDGDDYIDNNNSGTNVIIDGGADNDSIRNTASNVTITGGAGADTVYNVGSNVLIQYTSGDGNDTINDLSTTSTLSIAGAAYTSIQSGSDIVLGVGTGSITLVGAADLSTVNIIGTLSGGDSTDSGTLQGTSGNDSLEIVHEEISWAGGIRQTIYSALYGLAGDDTLENVNEIYTDDGYTDYKNNVIMDGGTGNDLINNYGANSKLTGGDGNDFIVNHGDNVTISGGAGNDTISNDSDNVSINAGDGDNSIDNSGTNVTLDALGNGNDSVYNTGNGLTINTGAGNNHVYNSGATLSITAGDGNDYIINDGSNVTINAGAGNNSIIAGIKRAAVINTGAGNDSISNNSNNSSISTGDGSDTIRNYGDNSSISTGAGNDSIRDSSDNSSISTGAGNDSIDNTGDNVTISGGAGDDYIRNIRGEGENILIQYASGDGNDSITGFNATSTISIDGAAYTSIQSGSDIVLGVGTGSITLVDAADLSTVNIIGTLSGGSDTQETAVNITNTTSGTVITGSAYGDTITNRASNVTINALGGNDIITNNYTTSPDNVLINGGAGSDTIENAGDTVQIDAGAGNDSVYSHCEDVTISGAGGNDTIVIGGDNHLVQYSSGDGNDYITGFKANSSISIGGAAYTSVASGSNIILGVVNGSITLEGAASLSTVNIIGTLDGGGEGVTLNNTVDATMITGTAYADSITNSGDGVTIQALAGNDTIRDSGDSSSIDAGDGSNLIDISGKNEVILLKGRTTVAGFNTGFGDGSDTIYIKPENDPAGVEFLDDGLTFGNDTASLTLSDVKTTAKVNLFHENRDVLNKGVFIAAGDWYKVEDSDLTVGAGEEVYFVGTAATPKAGVDFSGINADLNLTIDTAYIDSEDYVPGTTMWINGVYSLKGGAGNTTITGSANSDTILAGTGATTINAAAGNDLISLSGSSSVIEYADGDGNDTVYGFSATDTLSVDSTYKMQVSGNDLIVTVGESKITLVDAAKLSYPNIESSNPLVQVVEAILKRTAAGYPVIARFVFNPEEITGPEPDNYAAKEAWTITSADNLELYGVHYTPENSNDKWVVLVHGYGLQYESMNPFATFYLANNYNVLMIDQRAAGKSEGTWLTMGVAESQDVALWTQEIVRRNSNAKITLHGVSMGAATAMLAAARSDTKNVTSIVEDCGYSDVMTTFGVIVANHPELAALGISSELIPLIDPVAESLTGYYLHDAAPINSISSVKLPSLFISGDDDGVAPVSMLSELYDASGAEVKEKFIVAGAGHAQAGLNDSVGYSNAVFRFVAEADGEGWATENVADNISLRGTKYGDTLANSGDGVTISTGAGNDSIDNTGDSVSIDAGAGNDSVYSHCEDVTISGAGGNDTIVIGGDNHLVQYSSGDGNDLITGFKANSSISIGGAAYTSVASGSNIILGVGTGSVTLSGAASLSTVNIIGTLDGGTTPADIGVTVDNTANNTLITGTAYADSIVNSGVRVTIQALAGNDYIANVVDSSVTTASLGNSIDAGDGNDTIYNYHSYNPTLLGGAGNDSIVVQRGHRILVNGDDGADTILGLQSTDESPWAMGGYATLYGGAGNDYISPGYTNNSMLNGGSGNDTIIMTGADSTITGNRGNDVISLGSADSVNVLINYANGDGNDTVIGLTTNDTISISGAEYSSVQSGNDVVLTIGDGKVTLTDAANLDTLNIIGTVEGGGEGTSINNTASDTVLTGTPYDDTIISNGDRVSIGALGGNDTITFIGQDVTINAGTGNDTIRKGGFGNGKALIEYKAGDGNDYIYYPTSNDTLSIAGAAYSSIESDDDMILVVEDNFITLRGAADRNLNIIGEYTDTVKPGEYIINRLSNTTVTGTPLADTISNYGNYVTIQALASQDSLRNYGNRVSISGGTGDDYIDNYSSLVTIEGDSGNDTINNISGNYVTVWTGAGNDSVNNGGNYVTIRADAGDDTIINSGDNVVFVCYARNGGNDLIQGFKANSTLSIVADIYDSGSFTSLQSGNDIVLTFISGGNTVTLQGAATLSTVNIFGGGEVGISVNNTVNNTIVTGTDCADTLTNSGNYVTINAGKDNDTIYSSGDNSVIDAGTGNDTVRNGGDNTSIFGGAGNDSIMSDGGGMTITGGKGDDTINSSRFGGVGTTYRYTSGDGNDFIQNFENEDTLVVIGSDFTTTRANDAVVVVTVGEGQITLLGAEGTPNIVKESGGVNISNTASGTLVIGTDYKDTITNTGTRVTVQALDGNDYIANVVDSSVTTASLGNSISAGDGNDTIYNYHSYNPTLEGGAGDDSIVVSNGHLTYIDGGNGNDTILGQLRDTATGGWRMGGHATILGGEGEDYIAPGYSNDSSIDGGTGNDTIRTNGANSTIDGGTGNNLIQITTTEEGVTGQYVVMNGKTTVENFGTGFGSLSDTVLIAGDAPAVDFKSDGLTFYSGNKSLTLSDVTTTARVNMYYAAWDVLTQNVYIADNEWHNVTDLERRTTDNLYYVGATASKNHGLNFNAVTGSLNMTLDTDYTADTDFYVNNVYSIRGGAGNTTITGSAKSDTILAGTGSTTINAGAGGDILSGNGNTTFNIDSGATTWVNGSAGDSLNVSNDSLIFMTDGTAYIVNGRLRRVSGNTVLESAEGDIISGDNVKNATVIDGVSTSLTSADRELVIGKRGASLKGYTLDKAFIRNEADAATLVDLINATDSSQLVLDSGTFYIKNQSPIVLEDYDTSRGTFVNIKTADGRKNIFGWSPLNGGIVDGNSIDKPQIIFGDAPNGNSTIRGGSGNDSIYAGASDVVSLSGGHDELHINDETSHGVTVDMGDGSAQSRTRIVDGFDVTRDLLKIDSPENINARILDGSLQFIKGDSRVTFDELATFDDANGLQVQVDGRTYELRNDYDSGLKGVDYFWTDTDGNYYITDSTFRIFDDGSTREYFIAEGSGKLTIDGFNFGRDNDKLNLNSIGGLTAYGDNLYIASSGDSDVVEVTGGAGKTIDVKLDGTTYTAQLGKHLTYDLDAEYYGDLQGGTGCAISVAANFAHEEVAIYLNEEEEADGKIRYYGGVTKIDASAFTGRASLVGSEFNDKIIAAQGDTSLWGGEGGDDELFGTGSGNSFFYCLGNGDDKIYNAADGDSVNLVDITLDNITNSIISDGAVTLELIDGGRLTVMNSADVTFNLGDGTSWKADRQSKEWQQQA